MCEAKATSPKYRERQVILIADGKTLSLDTYAVCTPQAKATPHYILIQIKKKQTPGLYYVASTQPSNQVTRQLLSARQKRYFT